MSEDDGTVTLGEFGGGEENEQDQADEADSERIETPVGVLPSDWALRRIDKICEINPDGFYEDEWPDETFEYISLSEVSEGEILGSQTTKIDEAPSRAQRQVRAGDVLVGTVRPKQASHGYVTDESDGKICSSGFGVLRVSPAVKPLYLLQEILSRRFFRQMEAYVAGSGYPAVKIGDLRKLRVALPPLPEQRKIATVLHDVDRAIRKTEEIIEQTERVKQGTMQNLFRSGVDDEETRETWLGEIPASWDVVEFSEVVEANRNGLYKQKDAYGEGFPIAKMGNALDNRILDMSDHDRLALTEDEQEKYGLTEGDLIFARRAQEVSGAGHCTYVPELDELTVFESSLIRVELTERAVPMFYAQYFEGPVGSRAMQRIVTETSISGIATSDLLNLDVPLPSVEEQEKIATMLSDFDSQVRSLRAERDQLQRFKRGLMQDLLSGEVRTTDADIDVLEEVERHG